MEFELAPPALPEVVDAVRVAVTAHHPGAVPPASPASASAWARAALQDGVDRDVSYAPPVPRSSLGATRA